MKKYILNVLCLFIVQNMCAMELDPLDRCVEYDEKCWSVAKYLHHYPKGENEKEAKKIEWFLKDEMSWHVTVLPLYVKKYKNIFDTMEAEEYLHDIYTYQEIHTDNPHWNICKKQHSQEIRELPLEVKKRVLRQALSYAAEEYYVTYNMLKFLNICTPQSHQSCSSFTYSFYKPYFLAEINEENAQMEIVSTAYDRAHISSDTKMKFKAHFVNGALISGTLIKQLHYYSYESYMKKLISFLNAKNERVNCFKIMFNNYIEQLSQMNEEAGIKGFIFLLERFKGLTKHTIFIYTGRDRLT